MTFIRPTSDWHTEFWVENFGKARRMIDEKILPPLPNDSDTIAVLAGDIGNFKRMNMLYECLRHLSTRFKAIFYIPGNHEFYQGNWDTTCDAISLGLDGLEKVWFGSYTTMSLPHENPPCAIRGCTLWTDYDKGNPLTLQSARAEMNDYKMITRNGIGLFPEHIYDEHQKHLFLLSSTVQKQDFVVTHHAPTFMSIHEKYSGGALNGAYASDLSELILDKQPRYWFHGHTHDSCEYQIGATTVICNPFGYPSQVNKEYNPRLVIEV